MMSTVKLAPSLSTIALCVFGASVAYALTVPTSNPTDQASQLLATRTYNAAKELVSEGDADNQLTSYQYNTAGQKILTVTRDKNDLHQSYNDHGLLQTSWADKSATSTAPSASASDVIAYQYDSGNDQLTQTSYQQLNTDSKQNTTLAYDLSGQLMQKTYPSGKSQSYTYTRNGSVATFTNVLGQVTQYTYSPMKQLTGVQFLGATTTYAYDPFGRMLSASNNDGVETTWTYDDYNGVHTMTHKDGSTQLNTLTYTYNIDGNIANKTLATPSATATYGYGYNSINELTHFTCSGTLCPKDPNGHTIQTRNYTYTLNKGIQSMQSEYGSSNLNNTATYHYDTPAYPDRLMSISNSNSHTQVTGTNVYDADGNMIQDGQGNKLTYDALDQMLAMKTPSDKIIETYGYNADGKLDQQTPVGQQPIQLYYSTGKTPVITARTEGTAAVTYALGTDRIARYYFENDTAATSTLHQDYLFDEHGDVLNTVSMPSGSQDVSAPTNSATYLYTPYGYLSHNDQPVTLSTTHKAK